MQIKNTLRFHIAPVRMAKIKNTSDSSCWKGCGGREHSSIVSGRAKLYNQSGNQYGNFSENWVLIYLQTESYSTPGHILKGHAILPQGAA